MLQGERGLGVCINMAVVFFSTSAMSLLYECINTVIAGQSVVGVSVCCVIYSGLMSTLFATCFEK